MALRIGQAQTTSTFDGKEVVLEAKGRHDPCVLPRTPPLVEGMAALVLADAALIQRTRLYARVRAPLGSPPIRSPRWDPMLKSSIIFNL